MTSKATENAVVVFTARSPERIIREGGSQAWALNPARARQCTWLVCTQNQHNSNHDFSDATEPHGSAFLLGRISGVRKSTEEDGDGRWLIEISEFARIDRPDMWDHRRYPVRYKSLEDLDIDPDELEFQPMPKTNNAHSRPEPRPLELSPSSLTIQEAKKALAAAFGVKPEAIEITIHG